MEELDTKKYVGVDLGRHSVQFSLYREGAEEMTEESFPLPNPSSDTYVTEGMRLLKKHMEERALRWSDFQNVCFTIEDDTTKNRERLGDLLGQEFRAHHKVNVIGHFRAFVEYVFHQERIIWDHNTLLFDYREGRLHYIMIDQIRRTKQKAYRAIVEEIDLRKHGIYADAPDKDPKFGQMVKRFLVKHPANIIFLTGEGFEGGWMKRTLTYLCAGRRVFLGQNLYANGACLLGIHTIPMMDEGMFLMDGPQMVYHTIGIIAAEAGKTKYETITTIGREWYNTHGSKDIILDKSHRVEFFYHNTKENEIEGAACEVTGLPKRPSKTTRLRIDVHFTAATEGVILLEDLGFGELFPATGKITVFPFSLIS